LWSIVGALLLGIILGRSGLLPEKIFTWTEKITVIGLIILLFTMGLGIGGDPQVFNNLDSLGLQAFVLASGSILGSILIAWFLQKRYFGGEKK